jgi:hypothetical protein
MAPRPHLALVLAGRSLPCCAGAKVVAQAGVPAATSAVGAQLADGAGRASVACTAKQAVCFSRSRALPTDASAESTTLCSHSCCWQHTQQAKLLLGLQTEDALHPAV